MATIPTPPLAERTRRNKNTTILAPTTIQSTSTSVTNFSIETTLKALVKSNQDLQISNNTIIQKLKDVEASMDFLSTKYDEIKLLYDKITNENAQIQKSNVEMKTENQQLHHKLLLVNTEINDIKQHQIRNNMVIFGAPNIRDTISLKLAFKNLMDKLHIRQEDVEITDIFQKRTNTEQAPIFVSFKNYKTKLDILQIAKTHKLFAHNLGFENNNNKITMVDQLIDNKQILLKESKILRSHGFKYIWTRNGQVLVRQTDTSNIIIIKSLDCIENLKSNTNVTL